MELDFQSDVAAIQQIGAVSTILDVVCRVTGMRFAAVARVTEYRWIACGVKDNLEFGLKPGDELKIETTICNEIRKSREPVIIDHVAEDKTWCKHPIPEQYGFQSYFSMPIVLPDGRFFGTLCALDPRPARLKTPEVIGMFKLFAELIAFHLDALDRVAASEGALLTERKNAELREKFVAVLGHDLLNPLTAIDTEASTLLRLGSDENITEIATAIRGSVRRMSTLINDLRDFARGRFGGGLTLKREALPLEPVLSQIVVELRMSNPGRDIETKFRLHELINCDRTRIAQLLSNLLANALNYGAADSPIRVQAFIGRGTFELSVSNTGEPIPADAIPGLFEPFSRGGTRSDRGGLGLGLYIASEIARAHRGTLTASSSPEETRFTFRMPPPD